MSVIQILITGSKTWDDYNTIARAISIAVDDLISQNPNDTEIVVRHGDCPTGADSMADEFANKLSRLMASPRAKTKKGYTVRVEKYPANWYKSCNEKENCQHVRYSSGRKWFACAGFVRNEKMVSMGADICLAFIKNNSPGASGTARLAEKAGIRVVKYTS